MTGSEEFTSWLAGSKLIHSDGNPVVLYHGTIAPDFSEFIAADHFKTGMFGRGINLTSDPVDASKYASNDLMVNHDIVPKAEVMASATSRQHAGELFSSYYRQFRGELTSGNGRVIPVVASIKNPLVIGLAKLSVAEHVFKLAAAEIDIMGEQAGVLYKRFQNAPNGVQQFDVVCRQRASPIYRQIATLLSRDGLIIDGALAPKSNGAHHVLALHPEQIRSAIETRPFWNKATAALNITKMLLARNEEDSHLSSLENSDANRKVRRSRP